MTEATTPGTSLFESINFVREQRDRFQVQFAFNEAVGAFPRSMYSALTSIVSESDRRTRVFAYQVAKLDAQVRCNSAP